MKLTNWIMKTKPLIGLITLPVLLILQGCFGETKLEHERAENAELLKRLRDAELK